MDTVTRNGIHEKPDRERTGRHRHPLEANKESISRVIDETELSEQPPRVINKTHCAHAPLFEFTMRLSSTKSQAAYSSGAAKGAE